MSNINFRRFLDIEKKTYKLLLNLLYLYFLHALQAHGFFTDQTSYKRCRRRIVTRGSVEGPAAGTPLSARWQQDLSFDFDTVRQRLVLDSPPRTQAEHEGLQGNPPPALSPSNIPCTAWLNLCVENFPEQQWVWTTASVAQSDCQLAGSKETTCDLKPFALLNKTSPEVQEGKSAASFSAPTLLDDYYTNLLDCSCDGVVALALGSSVYLWNSETRRVVGHLDQATPPGQPSSDRPTRSISCLCWSGDGRILCIGTRRRELQLWDVEHEATVRPLPSHLSVVGALSWKQNLLSSGSVLGCIQHVDPRAPAPLIGAAFQRGGLCSLQWSPDGTRLASGSPGGLLSIWDGGITGFARSRQPLATMEQPTAVKAMGWCPWQRNVIATGGGWKDGQLRIWDAESGTCVTAAGTSSQVCSLRWAERKRSLVTGHGLPRHHIARWSWDSTSLVPTHQLTGHSQRVLHLALNQENTEIFSAAADQQLRTWGL
ncbi:cell division cycle protein 20 homolog B-like [Nelusetta ayraudi]|uniref:cell division cycle protein 20 homolog B-like n=1 Tax=Nelusetta ayraudi TaxID=303726 RepID=UPI003F701157